ncbi:cytochrome P450 [Aspergillus steynii IBT 23096]|uniref:Cytochrome P450 n=1 Tax=Aspergillus steynii IBT 23096 TaxID=1392250 RepID=A0A2I2GDH9_9EURO|nr:cytochrome P450 [Aspergillus steynii IBT 23096]PLB50867.1 cytochrome P450 [Aspergillus steynii IBT 23096]
MLKVQALLQDVQIRVDGQLLPLIGCATLVLALVPVLYIALEQDIGIPLVRDTGKKRFQLSTFIAYFFHADDVLREAYDTYLKHGRICRIPDKSFGTMIVLPNCHMRWMLSQPQSALDTREAIVDIVQARWTVGHERYFTDEWHPGLLRRSTRSFMETEIPNFQEELELSLSSILGKDETNWKEVNLAKAVKLILIRSTSRYIVGSPLCGDDKFIKWTLIFMEVITPVGEILRPMPQIFVQIIGRVLAIPRSMVIGKLKGLLQSTYDERLNGLKNGQKPEDGPKDFLQHLMRQLYEAKSPDLNLHFVTTHIVIFLMAASVQLYMLTPHIIFDMLASDHEYGTMSQVQEELNENFGPAKKNEPRWTRNDASKLIKLDSILRESLRLNPLLSNSMSRKVMVSGLQTPDGYTLPKGSTVALLARTVQKDPDIYPEPEKFVPFRFAGPDGKRLGVTSSEFLAFGHAQYGCPGRFLVAVELKMLLAYLFRHYEVELPAEYDGKRPPAMWITDMKIPPQNGKIRLRKKPLSEI